jgi:hypothetical protein
MKKNTLFALCALSTLACFAGAQQISSTGSGSGSSNASVAADRSGAGIQSNNRADASEEATVAGPERHRDTKAAEQPKKASGRSKHPSSESASAAQGLAAGTTASAVLAKPLDSRKCKPGDPVQATAAHDVKSDGNVVIPKGSHLIGHVTEVKSKGNGEANSSLGIVFDHAVLKDGRQVPMNSVIQALAAAQTSSAASLGDDNFGAVGGGNLAGSGGVVSRGGATGGGLLAGASSTAGAATGSLGNLGGNATGIVSSGVGSNASGGVLQGALSSTSSGVIGLKDLSLAGAATSATEGSVITSPGKSVHLDSGTQMVLRVVGR